MSSIKLYTDEDVFGAVAVALRRRGYDVLTVPEANRLGMSDEEQLLFATQMGRCLFSFNARDYVQLHGRLLAAGQHHAGIIVSRQAPVGPVVRALLGTLDHYGSAGLNDQLIWLRPLH